MSSSPIEENIRVFCRLKPVDYHKPCVKSVADGTCKYIKYDEKSNDANQETVFPIKCFDQGSNQDIIFSTVAQPICDSVLKGYNGTIMAYGPTNSGKTFTMRGNDTNEDLGLIPRCMQYILSKVHPDTMILASYLQLYCEAVSDLLDPDFNPVNAKTINSLQIRERMGEVYVEGLSTYTVKSMYDLQDILMKGDERRRTSSTNFNLTSSRSHSVLIVRVCQKDGSSGSYSEEKKSSSLSDSVMQQSFLFLCDLAGSERATASSGLNYMRLEEAKAINLSLSALGNCMNALAENKKHIPYRDSKLTRLLSGSLGGGARTSIIVTVIPADDVTGEYLNTLRFASRASKVKVVANLVRYIDYEKLFNDTQKRLDDLETEKRSLALRVEESEHVFDVQSNQIDILKSEIQSLTSQLKLSSTTHSNSKEDDDQCFVTSNSANRDVITNQVEFENKIKQLVADHNEELQALREAISQKIKKEQATVISLEQEIDELHSDLKSERQSHLSTLGDLKSINQSKMSQEKEYQERLQDMYVEIESNNALLIEKNEIIEQLKTQLSSIEHKKLGRGEGEEMIPKSKLVEMEKIFMSKFEMFAKRIGHLESMNQQQQQVSQQQESNTSATRGQAPTPPSYMSSASKHPLKKALDYNNSKQSR